MLVYLPSSELLGYCQMSLRDKKLMHRDIDCVNCETLRLVASHEWDWREKEKVTGARFRRRKRLGLGKGTVGTACVWFWGRR
jgi:hypothetical protein